MQTDEIKAVRFGTQERTAEIYRSEAGEWMLNLMQRDRREALFFAADGLARTVTLCEQNDCTVPPAAPDVADVILQDGTVLHPPARALFAIWKQVMTDSAHYKLQRGL